MRELPRSIRETDAVEVLSGNDTSLQYFTIDALEASIPSDLSFTIRSTDIENSENAINVEKPTNSLIIRTSQDDPAILFLEGASNCSLLLAKDKMGSAVGLHKPFRLGKKASSLARAAIESINNFFSSAEEVIGKNNGVMLVSGANPDIQNNDQFQENTLRLIKRKITRTNLKLTHLLVKSSHSIYMFGREQLPKSQPGKNMILPDHIRDISGLIYVPRQIDIEGKDRIFVLDHKIDVNAVLERLIKSK